MLYQQGRPCHYKRLHDLLAAEGYTLYNKAFSDILRRSMASNLITRTPIAGNVLYELTSDGKRLLHSIDKEIEAIVAERFHKSA
jgi:hypothetical protein